MPERSPLVEPPARIVDNVDVSYEDVPYPVVPVFTKRTIVHQAVEFVGVEWNHGSTTRVYVRTKCGKREVYADRRGMYWSAECKVCFRPAPVRAARGTGTTEETRDA